MAVAQIGGTSMILAGLLTRKKFLRYRLEPTISISQPLAPGNYGLSLVGAF
jgi:hypothetical protein